MKLAFSKPTKNEEQKRMLIEGFRAVGFDGLQLKGEYNPYLDEPERFYEDWPQLKGTGSALIAPGKLDPEGKARLRKIIAFAGRTGCELIVFVHTQARDGVGPDELRAFAREFSQFGREALDAGTKFSIHNHAGQALMLPADFEIFYDAAEDGTVGLTLDTAHLVRAGEADIAGTIRRFADVIDNYHLKDIANDEFRVLGQGDIDFEPVFTAIAESGFDGWVSCDEESGSGIVEAMEITYRFMRDGLIRHGAMKEES